MGKMRMFRVMVLVAASSLAVTLSLTGARASLSTQTYDQANSSTETAITATSASLSTSASIPDCAHDSTKWHALVEWDASGAILCTYGHEHKDDPHALDGVFGTWLYDQAGGQTISYPWQTGGGTENVLKHETYGYLVYKDLPPEATNQSTWYVRDLRIQAHLDMHAQGAPTRFHSSYIEARACRVANPSDCGIARWGGHQDYGELRVDGVYVPTAQDDPGYDPAKDNQINVRGHSATDNKVSWTGRYHTKYRDQPVAPILYGGFAHETDDAFGPLDPGDLTRLILTDPDVYNNSRHRLTFFQVSTRSNWTQGVSNGRITWDGYTRASTLNLNPACSAPGADCVPMSLENWPQVDDLSVVMRRAGAQREYREHDVQGPDGESLIRWPN